ncbi:5-oxoprolinase subunit C family protein [Burkholderia sp. MR1-5-21]
MNESSIKVLSSGALNLVQDRGRHGYMAAGVSRSGAMDEPALAVANLLVRNDIDAAAIEINIFPKRLCAVGDVTFACTGAQCRVTLDGVPVPSWSPIDARDGQVLVVEPPTLGTRAYLAFAGGIRVDKVMGSRATDLKAGFGGYEGRGLKRGDLLPLGAKQPGPCSSFGVASPERGAFLDELKQGSIRVRVLPAAEYDLFTSESIADFAGCPYEVTDDFNRVGYRLKGKQLQLMRPIELLSHGIAPGTVQVPPSGQPIVQMSEANTCGGYPKIATVVESDLWRLAQAPSGCKVQFDVVTIDEALVALQEQEARRERYRILLRSAGFRLDEATKGETEHD